MNIKRYTFSKVRKKFFFKNLTVRLLTESAEIQRWNELVIEHHYLTLGQTQGYKRVRKDFYLEHNRPKTLLFYCLHHKAVEMLCAEQLPQPRSEHVSYMHTAVRTETVLLYLRHKLMCAPGRWCAF